MIMLIDQNVSAFIRNASMDEINTMIALIRDRQRSLQVEIGSSFRVGDSVYFNDKRGAKVTGIISKVNRKTIKVTTPNGQWSVSPSLLNAA
jgi:uncharacterized protein YxjI